MLRSLLLIIFFVVSVIVITKILGIDLEKIFEKILKLSFRIYVFLKYFVLVGLPLIVLFCILAEIG